MQCLSLVTASEITSNFWWTDLMAHTVSGCTMTGCTTWGKKYRDTCFLICPHISDSCIVVVFSSQWEDSQVGHKHLPGQAGVSGNLLRKVHKDTEVPPAHHCSGFPGPLCKGDYEWISFVFAYIICILSSHLASYAETYLWCTLQKTHTDMGSIPFRIFNWLLTFLLRWRCFSPSCIMNPALL